MLPKTSDGWSLVQGGFDPATFQAWESLLTLGSGYLHVRGSLEEPLADSPQNIAFTRMPANVTSERFRPATSKWGTLVAGIYGQHPLLGNELINLPWFLEFTPRFGDETLDMGRCEISEHRRELRIADAVLVRSLRWRTKAGVMATLRFERFVSAARPFLCLQRMIIESVDRAEKLWLTMGVDTDVRTNGHDHLARVDLECRNGEMLIARVATDAGDRVEVVSRTPAGLSDARSLLQGREELTARAVRASGDFAVTPGRCERFEKRSAVWTTRDAESPGAAALLASCDGLTFDELHAEHAAVWKQRWDDCDVVVEGDWASQLALRVSLYHLLRSHVNDGRVAIDPKGYTGDAYWGRFFWDTEMFLLPFFLYTQPEKARTLVEFRVNTLAGAIENARRYGYSGARYAWESDAEGRECCPNWQYGDHEVHVTADVVYGLAHFAAATGEDEFLRGAAARVVVETARYWMERIDLRDGEPVLLGVMGPDEYTPISSNNSFTNRMVRFALELAARIGDAGGASTAERAVFADVASRLPLPRHRDDPQLVLQCDEFPSFAEPQFERFWKQREKTFGAQVSQERLYRSKCLKQADVLMLMMLFPQDYSDREVARAWEYYLPYTTHDSSLSPGAHAIVACRLGKMDDAWRFWQQACAIDLDVEQGGAREGIHIANCGVIWQMAVCGFAGVRTAMQSDELMLAPRLPEAWRRLAFPFVWKGSRLFIDVRAAAVTIENRGARAMEVRVWGESRTIAAGASAAWKRGAAK